MKRMLSMLLAVLMLFSVMPIIATAAEYTSGYYTYTLSNNKATIVKVDSDIGGAVTIPSSLNGYTVVAIGNSAFSGNASITSVVIPNTVTTIGDYAFERCSGITNLTIGSKVTSIGYEAFRYCSGLKSVTIPNSVTSISSRAFMNCDNITKVYFPASLQAIRSYAFNGCNKITDVYYESNQSDWSYVIIESGNEPITNANFHYSYDSNPVINYTISYNANGGTGAPASQTKTHGTALTLSSTKPTRTGYTFLGWSTSSTATSATYSAGGNFTTNANTTLYAVWKANTYNVKFNANGGSGTMSNQSFTYDTAKALTANSFTRTGYTFLGWSKSSTATSATYTNKQSVKNLTTTNGATVNLYAVWQKNESGSVNNFTFNIQDPSRTTIRYKDGIVLHANVEGNLPNGARIEWTADNNKFKTEKSSSGEKLTVISNNNGYTVFTATVYDVNGKVLASDSIEMYSKAGFFDKIGGFFRGLFGLDKIYDK